VLEALAPSQSGSCIHHSGHATNVQDYASMNSNRESTAIQAAEGKKANMEAALNAAQAQFLT
jgi:hypothetical protein